MSNRFSECVAEVLIHEGGFVDHPSDPGGATNHGISLRYARSLGSQLDLNGDGAVDRSDIVLVTPDKAAVVYRNWFWRDVKGDELPGGVDLAMFDFAVNSGAGRAIRTVQNILGLTEDGVLGPLTMAAIKAADPADLTVKICDARMAFLRGLRTFPTFGRGWTRRVTSVRLRAQEMVGTPAMTIKEAATTNTGQGTAIVATAGAAATVLSQAQPVIDMLGRASPVVAVVFIVAVMIGVWAWRTGRV
jgi:lysozyme family protein